MTPEGQFSVDGVRSDGVGHYQLNAEQWALFDDAREALSRFRTPILAHAANSNEYLYIAAFDGTGNSKFTDPEHATNVAKISDQLEALRDEKLHVWYVEGPGTQASKLEATLDGVLGYTYEERINGMYDDFVQWANKTHVADPAAVIRVHSLGFSRGASQAAGFTVLLHEKGIPDLKSEIVDADGTARYTRYHVAPGETVQTVGLFDPVATGVPMQFDRRLPPSVVSGFQITALNEERALFPSDQILPPGLSEDGRFLNVGVPVAHSDAGGGYWRDGLSTRCGNLMIDYCNALRDTPFLEKYYESPDPRLNVIHRSYEGQWVFQMDARTAERGQPSGTNTRLVPGPVSGADQRPHPVAPQRLENLDYHNMPIGQRYRPAPEPIPMASAEAIAQAGLSEPFAPKVAGAALGVAGAAAMTYDAVHAAHDAWGLHAQGNLPGVQSTVVHYASRNVGMLGGAALGTELGAVVGIESGPGTLVTSTLGGVLGAATGDWLASKADEWRIYRQRDPQGHTWQLDPRHLERGWTIDLPPLPDTPHGQTLVADAALADRLNSQASRVAIALQLSKPQTPQDPFTQAANAHDTPSHISAPWVRDDATRIWRRDVTTAVMEHGLVSKYDEVAAPDRAAQLDQAAQRTIADNLSRSPVALAQVYRDAYEHYGWQQYGPMPEAVTHALHQQPGALQASDGRIYARSDNGQWTTPGTLWGTDTASARTHAELDATQTVRLSAQGNTASTFAQSATPKGDSLHAVSMYAQEKAQNERDPNSLHARLDRMLEAAAKQDWKAFREDIKSFADMQPGRDLIAHGKQMAQMERHLTQQHQADMQQMQQTMQQMQQQQPAQQRSHGMAR